MKRKECRKAGLLLALTVLALRGTASEPPAVARMEGPKLLRSLDPDEFNFKFNENSYFVLRLTIDTSGHVGTVEVTNRGFVNRETLYTATQYAKTLRFKPAARDGVPIETKVLLPFEFQMRDSVPIRSEYRFRRNFTFDTLKGKIRKISLNCQGQFRDLEYAPGVEWAIPKSWDDCSLWVDGDPGTTFNIVEFADATPAPPPLQ